MATIMVRDLPEDERPREKLAHYGASSLSNAELLAVLLRTGTREESVLRLAERVLVRYRDTGLASMVHASLSELSSIQGIGTSKAAAILAAVELGQRIAQKTAEQVEVIDGPADVARFAMPHFRHEQKEHFAVLLLNTKNHILAMQEISVGSLSASIVHPREVFRTAIRYAAAAIILMHNHPSGDPEPSRDDITLTQQMVKAGEIMGIPVLDHVVMGDGSFVSMKDRGLIRRVH